MDKVTLRKSIAKLNNKLERQRDSVKQTEAEIAAFEELLAEAEGQPQLDLETPKSKK